MTLNEQIAPMEDPVTQGLSESVELCALILQRLETSKAAGDEWLRIAVDGVIHRSLRSLLSPERRTR